MNQSLHERYLAAKRRLFEAYYADVNQEQREAVFTVNGSLLVLAGAGSGKTTVLVRRILHLIRYGNAYASIFVPPEITEEQVAAMEQMTKAPKEEIAPILSEFIASPAAPWQVLAITFTNKAANEIKHRLATAMGDETMAKDIWAGTFHSVCMRILRVHGEKMGYAPGFTVYDASDSERAIKDAMKQLNLDEKLLSPRAAQNEISRAKDRLLTWEQYRQQEGMTDYRHKQIAKIYEVYAKSLMAANALDFDDIILQTVRLLEQNEQVREFYQQKFRYVLVDEFQDTNEAQFRLTSLLCGGHQNIMVVGDDDQSIYKFRGAVIENILQFDRKMENTKIIKLERNYRSTAIILDAANAVIAKNRGRKGKNLWTERQDGHRITCCHCNDQNSEARYLTEKIQELVARKEASYRDIAILYRANAQSSILEKVFVKSGVPYRMLGGLRFNDRKEIRDIVAYLQLIVNPADRERMKRIINEPKRKIGPKTIEAVVTIAEEQGTTVSEILRTADRYEALSRSASKLMGFAEMMDGFRALLKTDITLEKFVQIVLDRSGYRQMLEMAGEEEKERLDNLEEFVSGVIEYEANAEEPTLVGFLEETSLVADVDRYDEEADAVVMMTVHSAKGLEFPTVFLPGWEETVFPAQQSVNSPDPADMEEERRLAYVAITRAKNSLFITYTKERMLYGRTNCNPPSRFLRDIPEELCCEDRFEGSVPVPTVKVYYSESGRTASDRTRWDSPRSSGVSHGSTMPKKPSGDLSLQAGDRVRHVTFGDGEILSARPMGGDVLYEVIFDTVGTKKLMGTYARLKKL